MKIDNIINVIDIRAQYDAKMIGCGELPFSDAELKAQLEVHLGTAVQDLVELVKVPGAEFGAEIADANVNVTLSVGGNNMQNVVGLETAVKEYLENEITYLWWQAYNEKYADASARLLLVDKIRGIIKAQIPVVEQPKRVMKPVFVPEGRYIYE